MCFDKDMQRFNTPGGDVGNGQRDRKGKESVRGAKKCW